MKISSGSYRVWEGFSLSFDRDLDLIRGNSYMLRGENGSGKSSFLKQILIPALVLQASSQYLLYFEQQMMRQLYAIRADAALKNYPKALKTEEDCIHYLLDDLAKALAKQTRPVYALIDESAHLEYICRKLQGLSSDLILIFADHHHQPSTGVTEHIDFIPQSPYLSSIYESSV